MTYPKTGMVVSSTKTSYLTLRPKTERVYHKSSVEYKSELNNVN